MFYTVINKMFPHSQFNIICIYADRLNYQFVYFYDDFFLSLSDPV